MTAHTTKVSGYNVIMGLFVAWKVCWVTLWKGKDNFSWTFTASTYWHYLLNCWIPTVKGWLLKLLVNDTTSNRRICKFQLYRWNGPVDFESSAFSMEWKRTQPTLYQNFVGEKTTLSNYFIQPGDIVVDNVPQTVEYKITVKNTSSRWIDYMADLHEPALLSSHIFKFNEFLQNLEQDSKLNHVMI